MNDLILVQTFLLNIEEDRLKYYKNNNYDQFKDHVDVGDYNSARRFLVCFLYLNDVKEGEKPSFQTGLHNPPECGKILVFPCYLAVASRWSTTSNGTQIHCWHLFTLRLMNLEVTILSNLIYRGIP